MFVMILRIQQRVLELSEVVMSTMGLDLVMKAALRMSHTQRRFQDREFMAHSNSDCKNSYEGGLGLVIYSYIDSAASYQACIYVFSFCPILTSEFALSVALDTQTLQLPYWDCVVTLILLFIFFFQRKQAMIQRNFSCPQDCLQDIHNM